MKTTLKRFALASALAGFMGGAQASVLDPPIGQAAFTAERGDGEAVGVNFAPSGNKINPDETGWTSIARTNAESHRPRPVAPINGSATTAAGYPAVPEPETYAMMLAGIGLLGAIARRRRMGKDGI